MWNEVMFFSCFIVDHMKNPSTKPMSGFNVTLYLLSMPGGEVGSKNSFS